MKHSFTVPVGQTAAICQLCDYFNAGLMITMIRVPPEFRGSGVGSQLLQEVLKAADIHQVRLFLEISAETVEEGFLSNDILEEWYRKHGFVLKSGIFTRRPKSVQ